VTAKVAHSANTRAVNVINDPEQANAFVLPNGSIFVFT
jgi:hypothetical protein